MSSNVHYFILQHKRRVLEFQYFIISKFWRIKSFINYTCKILKFIVSVTFQMFNIFYLVESPGFWVGKSNFLTTSLVINQIGFHFSFIVEKCNKLFLWREIIVCSLQILNEDHNVITAMISFTQLYRFLINSTSLGYSYMKYCIMLNERWFL